MALSDYGIIEDLTPARIGKGDTGGWRFVQMLKGEPCRIPSTGAAKTAKELVEMVRLFRINNQIPMADVEFDISEFIKSVSPMNDKWKGGIKGQPRIREITPMIEKCRDWIDFTARRRPELVLRDEAAERAKICAACPQNIRWHSHGCQRCNTEVEYHGNLLRLMNELGEDELLKGCRLTGMWLKAGVFMDQSFLPARPDDAPTNCWLPSPRKPA